MHSSTSPEVSIKQLRIYEGIILIGIIVSLIRDTALAAMQQRIRRRIREVEEEIQPKRSILGWLKRSESHKNKTDGDRPQRAKEDHQVWEAEQAEISYEDSLRRAIQQNQSQSYRHEVWIHSIEWRPILYRIEHDLLARLGSVSICDLLDREFLAGWS